jgi:2-aminobenzoate-CoA ligase
MSVIPEDYLPPFDHLPKKIYRLPELQVPQNINIVDFSIDRHIRAGLGDKVLLYFREQKITYSDMQQRINRFANALKGHGIGTNDRVMLRSPNNPEIFIANFACWRIGAIPVPSQHLLRADEIAFRANDSEAKALVVSSDTFADVRDCLDRRLFKSVEEIIVCGTKIEGFHFYDDLVKNQPIDVTTEQTSKDDWTNLIYSSGTTGRPKGILATAADLINIGSYGRHINR